MEKTSPATPAAFVRAGVLLAAVLVAAAAVGAAALLGGRPYSPLEGVDVANDSAFMAVMAANGRRGYVEVERYDFAVRADHLARRPTAEDRHLTVYDDQGIPVGQFIIPKC